MVIIKITPKAVQYFADMYGVDKNEAEEFLTHAINMCVISNPRDEVATCPDCGAKLNYCTECQKHVPDEKIN